MALARICDLGAIEHATCRPSQPASSPSIFPVQGGLRLGILMRGWLDCTRRVAFLETVLKNKLVGEASFGV